MKSWNAFTPRERDLARHLFRAMTVRDTLAAGITDQSPATLPVGPDDLYALARDRLGAERQMQVRAAMRRHPHLAAAFDSIAEAAALFILPQATAAASAAMNTREIKGIIIRWQTSEAEPEQTYLLINVTDPQSAFPGVLIARRGQSDVLVETLPDPVDGAIRMIVPTGSPVIEALEDWKTRIFLG